MTIYPVIIPTLCRYELFRKCVESLGRCTLADQTELIIGLDYPLTKSHEQGYKQISEYLDQLTKGEHPFKEIIVFRTDKNLGEGKNLRRILDYAYSKYDAVISTEDDNYFSPCFLEFVNKGLEKFKDDPRVTSICGYTAMPYYGVTDNQVILTHDNSAWGYGSWKAKPRYADYEYYNKVCHSFKDAMRIYKFYPALLGMLSIMLKRKARWGDTMCTTYNLLNNKFQLKPSFSMVRNMGQDGSGLHCGVHPEYMKQEILKDEGFSFQEGAIERAFEETKKINKCAFWLCLPKNRIKACVKLVYSFAHWLLFVLFSK
jgi:hypothetical protein